MAVFCRGELIHYVSMLSKYSTEISEYQITVITACWKQNNDYAAYDK